MLSYGMDHSCSRNPAREPVASGINVVLHYTLSGTGQPQERAATRIHLDGSGGLLIYRGKNCHERLAISSINTLSIEACRRS